MPGGFREQGGAVASNHLGIEPGAGLERPPLSGEIDVNQPEALGIAVGPFQIVQQRPGEIAAQVDAAAPGRQRRAQMVAQVALAQGVGDFPVGLGRIVERRAVFGDLQR